MKTYADNIRPSKFIQRFLEGFTVEFVTYNKPFAKLKKLFSLRKILLKFVLLILIIQSIGYEKFSPLLNEFKKFVNKFGFFMDLEVEAILFYFVLFLVLIDIGSLLRKFNKPGYWFAVSSQGLIVFQGFKAFRINWKLFSKDINLDGKTLSFSVDERYVKNYYFAKEYSSLSSMVFRDYTKGVKKYIFHEVVLSEQLYNRIKHYVE